MNTLPTHLVINAAIEKKFGAKFKIAKSAFLWGSVAPDIPLALLSLGYFMYNRYFFGQSAPGMMSNTFDGLYFNNPFWIASHNLLHSPTALTIYAVPLWRFVDKIGSRGHWWLSFVFGCMVHSVIDIFTHYNDGPLLFFPFDWRTRFHSPISYWDKAHYAGQFFWVELGINILLLGYLFLPKLIRRLTYNRQYDMETIILDARATGRKAAGRRTPIESRPTEPGRNCAALRRQPSDSQ